MAGVGVIPGGLLTPTWMDTACGPRPPAHSPRVRLRRPEDRLRRDHLRYASDLTDAEWAVLEPLFPAAPATGRPPTPLRRVLEAIFYVLRGGIPWRMLPAGFPP